MIDEVARRTARGADAKAQEALTLIRALEKDLSALMGGYRAAKAISETKAE